MSIKVMTMVWDAYPASGSELLAMLAMADWCNDAGSSLYPSMNAVAAKIRVSEKQARRIVQSIVERGFMRVVGNAHGGKPGTTKQFQIEVGKLRELVLLKESGNTAPAEVTPPANVTPPMQGMDPSQMAHKTPPIGGSLTVIEPLIEPSEKKSAYAPPLPLDLLNDWIAVRKAKKAGAITKTVMAGIAREAEKAGISMVDAVTACCEFGWQGFNAQWYADRTTGKAAAMTAGNSETAYQRSMRLRVAEVSPDLARPAPGAPPKQNATDYFQTVNAIEVTK